MKFIKNLRLLFACMAIPALIFSCKPKTSTYIIKSKPGLAIFDREVNFNEMTVINTDVVIYPGALITTAKSAKVIFNGRVQILSESQVFDINSNIEFASGSISMLSPCWFGAKGNDALDDTKAIQKTLEIAREYVNSLTIVFPIGKFIITETLVLGNEFPNKKSINLMGNSMSIDTRGGSSLQWEGTEGGKLLAVRNYCAGTIEGLDFTAIAGHFVRHNIELTPYDYQVIFRNCSFSGSAGPGSSNVNLNQGNNLQVSEIYFENCIFRGHTVDSKIWQTESAVSGGLANTKNFSFRYCSFAGYNKAAINLEVTDVLRVESCTFALNHTDIVCLLCNTLASSNYSEHSASFFRATVSTNVSFTTLMNNCFYGTPGHDYIITEGGGNLVLINNNFGGLGGEDLENKIKWELGRISTIFSVGNYFRNAPPLLFPYQITTLPDKSNLLNSFGDLIGTDENNIKAVKKPN